MHAWSIQRQYIIEGNLNAAIRGDGNRNVFVFSPQSFFLQTTTTLCPFLVKKNSFKPRQTIE